MSYSTQAFCEFPLIQAVLQPVQAHRGCRGAGEKFPAQETRPQSNERHQYAGGEPGQLRQGLLSAECSG